MKWKYVSESRFESQVLSVFTNTESFINVSQENETAPLEHCMYWGNCQLIAWGMFTCSKMTQAETVITDQHIPTTWSLAKNRLNNQFLFVDKVWSQYDEILMDSCYKIYPSYWRNMTEISPIIGIYKIIVKTFHLLIFARIWDSYLQFEPWWRLLYNILYYS